MAWLRTSISVCARAAPPASSAAPSTSSFARFDNRFESGLKEVIAFLEEVREAGVGREVVDDVSRGLLHLIGGDRCVVLHLGFGLAEGGRAAVGADHGAGAARV